MPDTRRTGTGTEPRRADARRNRQRILEAALEAFAAEGRLVPLDDIARRAGVGAGTVYRNFPTKEALFTAVVTDRLQEIVDKAKALAAPVTPNRTPNATEGADAGNGADARGTAEGSGTGGAAEWNGSAEGSDTTAASDLADPTNPTNPTNPSAPTNPSEAGDASEVGDAGERFYGFLTWVVERAMFNHALCDALALEEGLKAFAAAGVQEEFDAALEVLLRRAQAAGQVRADVDSRDVRALMAGCMVTERMRRADGPPGRMTALACDALRPTSVTKLDNETRLPSRNEGRCEVCGTPLTVARTGRPARFCGAACRQKAHRRRSAASKSG
ncbi:TetR/AcrR family transcriptional regulator [Actinomadura sp. NTSP31]|uniref:TetR/AcrR family transcriptional regulator n=1 Tax=Actinomadura sp. NTSP31 TaxID=1735447 RepID=UPI0035C1B9D1